MRFKFLAASIFSFFAVLLVGLQQSRRAAPVPLVPVISGKEEYCLTCHADLPEISPSHPIKTFGCVVCHGGERLALDASLAHSTMRGGRNPSDLDVVQESCGSENCHAGSAAGERDHIQRVVNSIQSTYAGAIASIRYTFGQQEVITAELGVRAVSDPGYIPGESLPRLDMLLPGADDPQPVQAFLANCMNCHLHSEPPEGAEYARLSGCAACHTPTANSDISKPVHRLTTAISYSQCNTCHNRGNYDLRLMKFVSRTDHPVARLQDYYQPLARFVRCEWTLDCVDCHTRREVMGDGRIYGSKKDIQYLRCRTCHGTIEQMPLTRTLTDPNDIAFRMAFLNPVIDLKLGDTILVTEKGEPLWSIRQLPDGSYEQFTKSTRQRLTFRAVKGTGCLQKPDQQESRYCHECHAVQR